MSYCWNKEIKILLKARLKSLCSVRFNQISSSSIIKHFKPLNVLFFGTDDFAVTCLQKLYQNVKSKTNHESIINKLQVVSLSLRNVPINEFSIRQNLVVHQWPNLPSPNIFDVGVVVSFGKLIPSSVINSFPHGMINVHPSLLPNLRGAAPIARAVERGFKSTGITIIKVAPQHFDCGLILDRSQPVPIKDDVNSHELSERLAILGAQLCLDTLRTLPEKLSNAVAQSSDGVSYAPKITPKDRVLDWSRLTSCQVWDKYRAYGFETGSHLKCAFIDSGKEMKIILVDISPCSDHELSFLPDESPPGTVLYRKRFKKLFIACKTGYISCSKLNVAGRDPCSAVGFRNGYLLKRIRQNDEIVFTRI